MIKSRYIGAPRNWSYKEYSCFDFPAHSIFKFDMFWGSLGTSIFKTQVHPQIILDPDYFPGCLSVSYDYGKIEMLTYFVIFWEKQQLMRSFIQDLSLNSLNFHSHLDLFLYESRLSFKNHLAVSTFAHLPGRRTSETRPSSRHINSSLNVYLFFDSKP